MDIRTITKNIIYKLQNNPLSRFAYEKEIEERSKLKLTDINQLSKPISIFSPTSEIHQPNEWYGHAAILKSYINLPNNYAFKFAIEHGMHVSEEMLDIELKSKLKYVLSYSKFREKAIKKGKKASFSVGPYIHYAKPFLTKSQTNAEKKRLGKVLLVFPSHSSVDFTLDFNVQEFYKKVKKLGRDFDTVRVCLYWKDVLRGQAKHYEEFECVTAGHIIDPLFLPRLKSIIESADLTVSSVVGNHVGYSIFLNKPHFIIPQKHIISGRDSEIKLIKDVWWKDKNYIEIVKAFKNKTDKILPEQKKLISYFWGFKEIKSKAELLKFVKITEKENLIK